MKCEVCEYLRSTTVCGHATPAPEARLPKGRAARGALTLLSPAFSVLPARYRTCLPLPAAACSRSPVRRVYAPSTSVQDACWHSSSSL